MVESTIFISAKIEYLRLSIGHFPLASLFLAGLDDFGGAYKFEGYFFRPVHCVAELEIPATIPPRW